MLSGTDYRYLKGAAFGWLAYYVLESFFVPLVQPDIGLPYGDAAVAVNLVTHLIYGLTAAFVLHRTADLPTGNPMH